MHSDIFSRFKSSKTQLDNNKMFKCMNSEKSQKIELCA